MVWHVASPSPESRPKDENDRIKLAVDGTRRVLRAAEAAGVGRVIVTSSIDAVRSGHPASSSIIRSEQDWSTLTRCDPYVKSKTPAEQAAWDFAEHSDLSVVAINPGLLLGPVFRPKTNVTVEAIRLPRGVARWVRNHREVRGGPAGCFVEPAGPEVSLVGPQVTIPAGVVPTKTALNDVLAGLPISHPGGRRR